MKGTMLPIWPEDRACVGLPVDMFYKEKGHDAVQTNNMLRRLCISCSALDACRTWAREHEDFGFWGGESSKARAAWRKANGVRMTRVGSDGDIITRRESAA